MGGTSKVLPSMLNVPVEPDLQAKAVAVLALLELSAEYAVRILFQRSAVDPAFLSELEAWNIEQKGG